MFFTEAGTIFTILYWDQKFALEFLEKDKEIYQKT